MQDSFKGHSVGRSAKDMHHSLWGKHNHRVRDENQQAKRAHNGCTVCARAKSAPLQPMRPCRSICDNKKRMSRIIGFAKLIPFQNMASTVWKNITSSLPEWLRYETQYKLLSKFWVIIEIFSFILLEDKYQVTKEEMKAYSSCFLDQAVEFKKKMPPKQTFMLSFCRGGHFPNISQEISWESFHSFTGSLVETIM